MSKEVQILLNELKCLCDLTKKYDVFKTKHDILDLSSRAYDLFLGSEVEERRQLIKLVLSNLKMEDKNIVYDVQKPFDLIVDCSERKTWCPLIDAFRNNSIEFDLSLQDVQSTFSYFL